MRFGYNCKLESYLKRWRKNQLFAPVFFILGLSIMIDGVKMMEDALEYDLSFGYGVIAIIGVIGCAYVLYQVFIMSVVCRNLSKGFLEFKEDRMCGYAYNDIRKNDDGEYFELRYDELRDIKCTVHKWKTALDLHNRACFYNVYVDYAGGTYRLSVDLKEGKEETLRFLWDQIQKNGRIYSFTSVNVSEESQPSYACTSVKVLEGSEYIGKCQNCGKTDVQTKRCMIKINDDTQHKSLCDDCLKKYKESILL